MAKYDERELTGPVMLCDDAGKLNRAALGWSRVPLHTCNLSGHWPRKKKWNFWMVLNEDFAFSATIANVDYLGTGAASLLDFKTRALDESALVFPRGAGVNMPPRVEEDVSVKSGNARLAFTYENGGIRLNVDWPSFQGRKLAADVLLENPQGHETLNVVIPWGDEEFHFTSKQNTLPASGMVTFGDKVYNCKPENTFGVLDFGRGMWPKSFVWNWAAFSHRQGSDLIGLNMGSKWTDGTGYNENGLCLNGRLYKISEDIVFTCNTSSYMEPWTMKSSVTDAVDLKIAPVYEKSSGGNTSLVKSEIHQVFGHFSGTVKADGKPVEVKDAYGWSELHIGSW